MHSKWLVAFDEKFKSWNCQKLGCSKKARKIFLVKVLKFGYITKQTGRCKILASSIYIEQKIHLSETVDEDW